VVAGCDLFERITRRYGKPPFDIEETDIKGVKVPVLENVVWEQPFCRLLHFQRDAADVTFHDCPKLLIIAPLSGHYATLLRGTVKALLPHHNLYITDWTDARDVPLSEGSFDLDDYIDYVMDMVRFLGPNTHVLAVCQPCVPALAATAIMASKNDPCQPDTLTMMGGPIDTRINPTEVNKVAEKRSKEWFAQNVINLVPFPNKGAMRRVYPGFLQLGGFMSMNMDSHVEAHKELFVHLVEGDGDSAEKHKDFYDEYLSVMDLPAEYYLQTLETVFIKHDLPMGNMTHNGEKIDLTAINHTALMTVEGAKDDITGRGQTEAALDLCPSVPDEKKHHHLQPKVGHYGIFNGSRFESDIAPLLRDFILNNDQRKSSKKDQPDSTQKLAAE